MSSKLTNKGNLTGEKNDVQPISGREQNWKYQSIKLKSSKNNSHVKNSVIKGYEKKQQATAK